MATLYLVSAGAGAGAGLGAALLFSGVLGATILGLSATGIGLVLVAVGIAIALLIEIFKSNDLQEWMGRCYFGAISEDARYDSFEDELDQFELAMKKLGVEADRETSEHESLGNAVAH